MHAKPACKLKEYEGHLLTYIRKLENQLDRYRDDDTHLTRSIRTLESEMEVAVRRAEEQGYARGLKDRV
jgi:hypothetical protein